MPLKTEGTMTAKDENKVDFVAESGFSIKRGATRWVLGATHRTEAGFRHIDFYMPLSLPDGLTTYELNSAGGTDAAVGIYSTDVFSTVSKEGTLTIEYFTTEQRMKGTFSFKGNQGNVSFNLTEGKFDLTGIVDKRTVTNNTFTADVKGGIAPTFEADTVYVTSNDNKKELALVAHQLVWEPLPPKQHRLTLFIANGVKKGEHRFTKFDPNIRAAYIDFEENYIFLADEGVLTLTADPSIDNLEATLEFTAGIESLPDRKVQVSNGVIRYRASAPDSDSFRAVGDQVMKKT